MYTPRQVSEMLSIPDSSLRRLAREFSGFLSKQKGRNRKYTEQDIAILKRVREMTGQGLTLEQIKQQLPLVEEQPPDRAAGDTLSLIPTISAELSRVNDNYNILVSEFEQLRRDRLADRERLRLLEEWLSLPWWKRLFSKPPQERFTDSQE